ncbi:MAG: hypothetical protein K0U62_11520 [Actinomycetia bacterium]|nr:hypothetical protein [Actinomycetes bacterium]
MATKMTPDQQEAYFQAEMQRVAALIGAALRDCWNWHVEQYLDDQETSFTPPDVVKSEVSFAALGDFGAKLVLKHTGNRIVFIRASGALTGWLPETMMFLVPPEKIPTWKSAILTELGETGQELFADWNDIQQQKRGGAEDSEMAALEDVSGVSLEPLDDFPVVEVAPRRAYEPAAAAADVEGSDA